MNNTETTDVKQHQLNAQAASETRAIITIRRHVIAYLFGSTLASLIYLITRLLPGYTTYPWFIWIWVIWPGIISIHCILSFYCFNYYRTRNYYHRLFEARKQRLMEQESKQHK